MQHDNNITHLFFYSEKQAQSIYSIEPYKILPTVNGLPYTEMRAFSYGWSNWDDAVLMDIAGVNNVKTNTL